MASLPYILISIEGDIGAGKTTLINTMRTMYPNWHFIPEPIETWQNLKTVEGDNLLELFYKNKERYSYTFQNCALLSRALNIKQIIDKWKKDCDINPALAKHNVFLTERCLETDFHVFAQMLYDDGCMNLVEWDLYKMWYNYVKSQSYPLSGIIYVSTPPEICADRIKQRGRKGEGDIPIEYLENLDKYQKYWLNGESISVPLLEFVNYGNSPTNITTIINFINTV
jgi:deoxyadenosine/deoxycytidine kinase